MKTLAECEAAMRAAAMALPPSDFGSHRAIQAAARVMFAELEAMKAERDEALDRARHLIAAVAGQGT